MGRAATGGPAGLLELGFGQLRRCSGGSPHVCIELIRILAGLREAVAVTDDAAVAAIEEQARLVHVGCLASGGLAHDLAAVTHRYEAEFGERHAGDRPAIVR